MPENFKELNYLEKYHFYRIIFNACTKPFPEMVTQNY